MKLQKPIDHALSDIKLMVKLGVVDKYVTGISPDAQLTCQLFNSCGPVSYSRKKKAKLFGYLFTIAHSGVSPAAKKDIIIRLKKVKWNKPPSKNDFLRFANGKRKEWNTAKYRSGMHAVTGYFWRYGGFDKDNVQKGILAEILDDPKLLDKSSQKIAIGCCPKKEMKIS